MECELCGKETEKKHDIRIEDAILTVCDSCVKYGTELFFKQESKDQIEEILTTPKQVQHFEQEIKEAEKFEIVENYSELIRKVRENLKMKQDDFAKFMNEKKSIVKKLETGKLVPNPQLVKKLEKKLKITLQEV